MKPIACLILSTFTTYWTMAHLPLEISIAPLTNSSFELAFESAPGYSYRLLSSRFLGQHQIWTPLTNILGDGNRVSLSIPFVQNQNGNFYTVEQRKNPLFGVSLYV